MGKGYTVLGTIFVLLLSHSGWAEEQATSKNGFDLRYYIENDGGVIYDRTLQAGGGSGERSSGDCCATRVSVGAA